MRRVTMQVTDEAIYFSGMMLHSYEGVVILDIGKACGPILRVTQMTEYKTAIFVAHCISCNCHPVLELKRLENPNW